MSSTTLVVGVGNTLRGDDGVAARVLDLLEARAPERFELEAVHSVLPELAAKLAGHREVIFVDADVCVDRVALRPLPPARDGLHRFAPSSVVAMARGFGFDGQAWLCSVPVTEMGAGEGLSSQASAAAEEAAKLLVSHER